MCFCRYCDFEISTWFRRIPGVQDLVQGKLWRWFAKVQEKSSIRFYRREWKRKGIYIWVNCSSRLQGTLRIIFTGPSCARSWFRRRRRRISSQKASTNETRSIACNTGSAQQVVYNTRSLGLSKSSAIHIHLIGSKKKIFSFCVLFMTINTILRIPIAFNCIYRRALVSMWIKLIIIYCIILKNYKDTLEEFV